jgi:alkylation response protein AidB-like acyl-CoA dehydrogenase
MQFGLSQEQHELATTVRSLLGKRSDSAAVRSAIDSDAGYDVELWQVLCEQIGVAALSIPDEYDGADATLFESAIVLEALGHNLTPSPLLATTIAAAAVQLHGSDEQKRALLPRLAAGEIATIVLDPAVVLDAAAAEVILGMGPGGTLVELNGAQVEAMTAMDQTMRFGSVSGDDVAAYADGPVRDVASALATAVQVGTAQRGLDMTVAYAKEREQFGRPIGSFQALKHRMADMLVLVETSRSASWAATFSAAAYVSDPTDDNAETLRTRAAVAQSWCSDALDQVAAETVQLHGGIAITWEHDAQLVFKRAHALSQLFGQAHQHRARLAWDWS